MSLLSRFRRQPTTRARGQVAETAAARWLSARGYEILERNVTTRAGEIDLVARESETLCFIEVKARLSSDYGPAVGAVNRRKRRRLVRAAALYLARHEDYDGPCRFDVVSLESAGSDWHYELFQDAFGADDLP